MKMGTTSTISRYDLEIDLEISQGVQIGVERRDWNIHILAVDAFGEPLYFNALARVNG